MRARDPTTEFKVWEAYVVTWPKKKPVMILTKHCRARATSAAPVYFKPFVKAETGVAFTDGGLHHNCPAWIAHHESRVLWEDAKHQNPDMFLSIGTGIGSQVVAQSTSLGAVFQNPRKRATAGIKYALRTVFTMVDDQLDCEKTWGEYAGSTVPRFSEQARRTMRLNVHLQGIRPKLDDVGQVTTLSDKALKSASQSPDVREVAHRLVASSFYLERQGGVHQEPHGGYSCNGKRPGTTKSRVLSATSLLSTPIRRTHA